MERAGCSIRTPSTVVEAHVEGPACSLVAVISQETVDCIFLGALNLVLQYGFKVAARELIAGLSNNNNPFGPSCREPFFYKSWECPLVGLP